MRCHVLSAVLLLTWAGAGCTRFYEAEIAGYIRDGVSKEGVNQAIVQVFYEDDQQSSYQQSFTQRYGDQDGYFVFRRVVWSTDTPLFGDEGDLHDIRITVEHEDYQPFDRNLRIVSGASNSVGDVYLDRAFFVAGLVEGRVRDREPDVDGEQPGINGLNVELYVPETPLADEAEALAWVATHNPDATNLTRTVDGDDGVYQFADVQWLDPGRFPAGDDERGSPWRVIVRVQDADFFELVGWDREIRSGETTSTLEDLFVDKKDYQGNLRGWVRDRSSGDGVNNATIEVYVPDTTLVTQAEVDGYIDSHDPDLTGGSRTFEEQDGYFEIVNIGWHIEHAPTVDDAHQRKPVILRVVAGDFSTQTVFRDTTLPRFVPEPELVSNSTVQQRDVLLTRTHFVASAEGYVRSTAGASNTGINGVRVSLYYDPQDPALAAVTAFDPLAVEFNDQQSTGNNVVADEAYPGFFRFTNIAWDNANGGRLAGGKDALTVILYSKDLDFSGNANNTDPRWQRFELISGSDGNVLPDLLHRDDATGFTAACEGYVRMTPDDASSGRNGVQISLYYDPQDPMLQQLASFDPTTARFSDVVSTGNQVVGDLVYAGAFRFSGLEWSNPAGPSLASGKDQLAVILFSEHVDFSSHSGNSDPRWQRFVLVSGDDGNVLPDLQHQP
ncbi:MAG: hypothetical protein ABIJ09_18705 [Pseudomonadota bacterium]